MAAKFDSGAAAVMEPDVCFSAVVFNAGVDTTNVRETLMKELF